MQQDNCLQLLKRQMNDYLADETERQSVQGVIPEEIRRGKCAFSGRDLCEYRDASLLSAWVNFGLFLIVLL